MADNEYNTPVPQGASLVDPSASTSPSPSQTDSSDYNTPVPQGASLADPSVAPFTTPSGNTYTPGQPVQHSSGATGQIVSQHPDSGNAVVKWYNKDANGNPITGDENGQQHTIRANDPQNAGTAVARWAEQVSNDVKYGTDFTGIGKVLKKLGAHGVDTGNPEAVGDWVASIPLGLLKLTKGVGETEGSTSAGGQWQAVKDLAGGAGQAATMPTSVIAPESAELEDIAGQAADHVGDVARNAVQAGKNVAGKVVAAAGKVPRKIYPEAIAPENAATVGHNYQQTIQPLYDELHAGVRNAVADAAEKAGVTVKPTESIQDMAMDAAKALRAKATKLYSQVDDAIEAATGQPGRFQVHDENLSALQEKLADAIGDPAEQAKYAKAIQMEEAAKAGTLKHIKNAGLGDVPETASALHKQGRALEDLGKKVQTSTDGLPGDLDNPERLNPKTFATSLRNLQNNTRYGSSRLEQALGKENAATLIQQTSDTRTALKQAEQLEAQRVADRTAKAKIVNTQRRIVQGLGAAAAAKATGVDKPILHAAEAIL